MLRSVLIAAVLVGGMSVVAADSADARLFNQRSRPARTTYSQPYRSNSYRSSSYRSSGPYVVRGPSPIPIHVSPARYRYLKTFYPNMVRDVR